MRASQLVVLGRVDLEIGAEDSDGPDLFGILTSLAVGPSGQLIIADYSDNTVRVFDRRGNHVQTFGRRGRGPGEFTNPLQLAHDGAGRVIALQGRQEASDLRLDESGVRFVESFAIGRRYSDVCFFGAKIVAIGWESERLLHVLQPDGSVLRSFGHGWSDDSITAVREANNRDGGSLRCDVSRDEILVTNHATGFLRSYTGAGDLRWQLQLPSFRPAFRFMQRSPAGSALVIGYGEDHVVSVWPLDSSRAVVQVRRVSYKAIGRNRSGAPMVPASVGVTSYVLDRTTGRLLSRSSDLPAFVLVLDGLGYSIENEPHPRVTRRPIRSR